MANDDVIVNHTCVTATSPRCSSSSSSGGSSRSSSRRNSSPRPPRKSLFLSRSNGGSIVSLLKSTASLASCMMKSTKTLDSFHSTCGSISEHDNNPGDLKLCRNDSFLSCFPQDTNGNCSNKHFDSVTYSGVRKQKTKRKRIVPWFLLCCGRKQQQPVDIQDGTGLMFALDFTARGYIAKTKLKGNSILFNIIFQTHIFH